MSSKHSPTSVPENLGLLIKRVQHGHHRALDAKLARLGLSLVQWNALREIARNPGGSQHLLALRTFNSDQAFGTLLTRLQARGLVERGPAQGRAAVHGLSAKGKALLRKGRAIHSRVLRASLAPLSGREQAKLARLLGKVLEARGA